MTTLFELLTARGLPVESATENGKVTTTPGVEVTPEQMQEITDVCVEYLAPAVHAEELKQTLYQRLVELSSHSAADRVFANPNRLSELIVGCRIAALDPVATVVVFNTPVDGVYYIVVKSTLTDSQIANELSYAQTAAETSALADYATAVTNFQSIGADWATQPADDLVATVNSNFFGGQTLSQMHTLINGVNSFAKVVNALTQIADQMYANKDRELKEIRAIAALRDYLIRLRKLSSSQQTPNRM